jgi:phosphoglycolate phosphatase
MRGILFDKDGTLIDFNSSWSRAYRELSLDLCGGDNAAAVALLAAGGLDPATGVCRPGSVLAAGNTIDIARFWFPQLAGLELQTLVARMDSVFYENGIRYSVLLPGAAEVLIDLQRSGYVMGVATSDGTAATKAALSALGLTQYLPHVFGYDSVPRPKPAPDIVHAFCAVTGLEAADIVVIGDNVHDLEMARSACAGAAIGVLSGTSREADLAPLSDAILPSIVDLPKWLSERRRAA